MKVYEIYEHPERGRKAVKVGFSWPAFFFHLLWALTKGLWLPAVAFLITAVLGVLIRDISVISFFLPFIGGTTVLPLFVIVCFGNYGNLWISQSLIHQGYQLVSKLNAKSIADALRRYEDSSDIGEPTFSPMHKYGSYVSLGIIICFWLLLKISFPAFYIAGPSMLNTLMINDRIFVNRFAYTSSQPKIGDIIAFCVPETVPDYDPKKQISIRRIVGLEGDHVTIENNHLWVNGQEITDPPFLAENVYESKLANGKIFEGVTVGEDQVLVFGDNSGNCNDSRYWGTIPVDNIIGKAVIRFWPLNRIGKIHGISVRPFDE